jgi:hypothetical protein
MEIGICQIFPNNALAFLTFVPSLARAEIGLILLSKLKKKIHLKLWRDIEDIIIGKPSDLQFIAWRNTSGRPTFR